MNQYQTLSKGRLAALKMDIHVRIELLRRRAEHTQPVMQMEYGVALNTIVAAERGNREIAVLSAEQTSEIRRRRDIRHITDEQLRDYTLKALAEKHRVCTGTVRRYVSLVRREAWERSVA